MSRAPQIEITGVLVREFRPPNCENFTIGEINLVVDGEIQRGVTIKVVGNAEPDELKLHLAYRWYGSWHDDPKFGRQFKFVTFTLAKPHGQTGVVKYLQECPHIGEATARQLWNLFGPDAVRVCRESPELVSEKVTRLKIEQAREIAAKLADLSALEDTSIELIDLLSGRGFPKATAREAVKRWGNRAPWVIQHDPMKLMAFCGFLRCDSMWMDLGLPPVKMKRQICCAWYSVASDTEGHTWHPESKAAEYLSAKISGVELDLNKAIGVAVRAKALSVKHWCEKCGATGRLMVPDLFDGTTMVAKRCPECAGEPNLGRRWIADYRKASAEDFVARHLALAELEGDPAYLSLFETHVERVEVIPSFTRCTRCHRKLTADTVAILNGDPYGPDCITKTLGGEAAEQMPLAEWLGRQPVVQEKRTNRFAGTKRVEFANQWPSASELEGVSDHQREHYERATLGRIGVFTGSPGTGKTYVAAAVVKAIGKRFGPLDVAIVAPTGKAAVRCTESMRGYGLGMKACTIHSLLGVESSEDGNWTFKHNGNWTFKHNERNPLPYKFILVDESSMIDTSLLRSLLAARARGTHVLFIGDPNQLPPVGHGAPLRDMIAARLPYGELREIKRNAGTVVRACAAIRDGQPFVTDGKIELDVKCPKCNGAGNAGWEYAPEDEAGGHMTDSPIPCDQCDGTGKLPPKNLVLITAGKSQAVAAIEKQVTDLRDAGIDAIWACQVIVAVNKRSSLARVTLNKRLQDLLNPGGKSIVGGPFRVGDKVICLKNSFFKLVDPLSMMGNEKGQVAVANGEFGKVLDVEPKKTVVEFFNPSRKVEIFRAAAPAKKNDDKDDDKADDSASGTGCDLDLGYAATCHKMQGSDCDHVIIALDEYPGASGKFGICKREWLLTAVSRVKIAGYLVGLRSTARTICEQTALDKRKTFLRELIEHYRVELRKMPAPKGEPSCQPTLDYASEPTEPTTTAESSLVEKLLTEPTFSA